MRRDTTFVWFSFLRIEDFGDNSKAMPNPAQTSVIPVKKTTKKRAEELIFLY
jgi:hypothetical protein